MIPGSHDLCLGLGQGLDRVGTGAVVDAREYDVLAQDTVVAVLVEIVVGEDIAVGLLVECGVDAVPTDVFLSDDIRLFDPAVVAEHGKSRGIVGTGRVGDEFEILRCGVHGDGPRGRDVDVVVARGQRDGGSGEECVYCFVHDE